MRKGLAVTWPQVLFCWHRASSTKVLQLFFWAILGLRRAVRRRIVLRRLPVLQPDLPGRGRRSQRRLGVDAVVLGGRHCRVAKEVLDHHRRYVGRDQLRGTGGPAVFGYIMVPFLASRPPPESRASRRRYCRSRHTAMAAPGRCPWLPAVCCATHGEASPSRGISSAAAVDKPQKDKETQSK